MKDVAANLEAVICMLASLDDDSHPA
jgi:hypothetical protein